MDNCAWANAEGNVLSYMFVYAVYEAAKNDDFSIEKVMQIAAQQTKIFEVWRSFVQIHTLQKYLKKRIEQCQVAPNLKFLSTALEKCRPPSDADSRLIEKYTAVVDLYEKFSKHFISE